MADIRKGDIFEFAGGTAEVQLVQANSEGGLDVVLRYAESREELSRNVYRKGGPDERDEDVETHAEDYEDDEVEDEELVVEDEEDDFS